MRRIIWQYWETKGKKPAFVGGLHEIAVRNSGCEVIQVTPETLSDYLPDLPPDVLRIRELAHKADMIRAMLVARYGGMWLDSDAIVLRDLNPLFGLLEQRDFVCFNDNALLVASKPWVRINCFLSRPGGTVVTQWVERQHEKFPRVEYGWEEIGTDLLHPICMAHGHIVQVLPFHLICPIPWYRVEVFLKDHPNPETIFGNCFIVMLSNATLAKRLPIVRNMSCHDIAQNSTILGAIMRKALRGSEVDAPAAIPAGEM